MSFGQRRAGTAVNSLLTGVMIVLVVVLGLKINRLLWASDSSAAGSQPTSISVSDLKRALDQQQRIVVLDVRPRPQYASGHIPSAKNIPLDELEVRAPNELNQDDRIVIYCRCSDDTRSDLARQALRSLGFKDVFFLKGGIQRWEEERYITVQTIHAGAATTTR